MDLYLHDGAFISRKNPIHRIHVRSIAMELGLQFGYGMMGHSSHLVDRWNDTLVVLSPRDLKHAQLVSTNERLKKAGGRTAVDPQFYLPHSDHPRLQAHAYWPSEYETESFLNGEVRSMAQELASLNEELDTEWLITPALLAGSLDEVWLAYHEQVFEAIKESTDRECYLTVALGSDCLRDETTVATIVERVSQWSPDGFYLVLEHSGGAYFVDDPIWLANAMDLVAGLRLEGFPVVVGYSNHQMLPLALSGATAICSGTWMNVRSFPQEKFRAALEQNVRRRATWYYAPQMLSEFKLPFMDIAHELGILEQFRPPKELDGGYCKALFNGGRPTDSDFTESSSFRHYLFALREQVRIAGSAGTFQSAIDWQTTLLDESESLLKLLQEKGVFSGGREFSDYFDVTRGAIRLFEARRGPVMRRKWSSL